MAVDPRIAATRRFLESQRSDRYKQFEWMSNRALGRAGGMSAGRRDKLLSDLTGTREGIDESYRSQLGLQEAEWKREDDLKRAQGQAATIKTIGTILGGVVGIPGGLAGVTAGMGLGAGAAGLVATAVTGEPDTAAMAPNELIAAIQGLSSTDYIDKAMAAIGMESEQSVDPRLDAVLARARGRSQAPMTWEELSGNYWGGKKR